MQLLQQLPKESLDWPPRWTIWQRDDEFVEEALGVAGNTRYF
ncbi:hypothetical protein [Alteromonas pelagimontana]|nr:hypothetical protein [Alteromonas pelagimontana]